MSRRTVTAHTAIPTAMGVSGVASRDTPVAVAHPMPPALPIAIPSARVQSAPSHIPRARAQPAIPITVPSMPIQTAPDHVPRVMARPVTQARPLSARELAVYEAQNAYQDAHDVLLDLGNDALVRDRRAASKAEERNANSRMATEVRVERDRARASKDARARRESESKRTEREKKRRESENKRREREREKEAKQREALIAKEAKQREALIAKEAKQREALIAKEAKQRETLIAKEAREAKQREALIAKEAKQREALITKEAREAKQQAERDARAYVDGIKLRYNKESNVTKFFRPELSSVVCGLTEEDGFDAKRIANIPATDLLTILNNGNPDEIREGVMAFEAQVKRIRRWMNPDTGGVFQQGEPGFNARVTRVLEYMKVDGARECAVASEADRPLMLHQATTRALFHPLTPIRRALVLHPTGTGKSFVLINTIENYFHDRRPKVIVTPSYVVQLQIVHDMITLLPSTSNLKRWYTTWHAQQPESVTSSPDYLWHVIAALGFKRLRGSTTTTSQRVRHEDEDLAEVQHDTGDEDDDVRPPESIPDRNRLTTLSHLREGTRTAAHLGAANELRAPIVFMTYGDHKLGMYRESTVFNTNSRDVSVSYNNKIVLVDEMHNLFDEHNPNLNAVQRRKLFGDKEQRERADARLEKASNDSERKRAQEAVLIFTGLAKILQRCQSCVLIGLTATPIVELRGDGDRAAIKVLEWIRGRRSGKGGGRSSPTPSSPASSPPSSPSRHSPTPPEQHQKQQHTFEGYVSYFGMRPEALFANADEISYPSIEPITLTVPPDVLATDEEGGTSYGMGRLRTLQEKYERARVADAWFDEAQKTGWFTPPVGSKRALVDYWDKSKSWSNYIPHLHESDTRMPEWGEGLLPFGRSLPASGQAAWLDVKASTSTGSWRDTRRPCWIESDRVDYRDVVDVYVGDTEETAEVLGRSGRVDVMVATFDRPVLTQEPTSVKVSPRSVRFVLADGTNVPPLRPFDRPVPSNSKKFIVYLQRKDDTIDGFRGSVETCDFILLRRDGYEDIALPNSVTKVMNGKALASLDYEAERWYYEEEQLYTVYAGRLERFKRDEGSRWMNVFYGGRELRSAQGSAALGGQTACNELGGMLQSKDTSLSGFAVDMARHIVPHAMGTAGKSLWLLSESHGLALVHKWLTCDEGRKWLDTGRVAIFGAYKNDERVSVQKRVGHYLTNVFNASDNLRGERCKLIIGGAGDLGVGVTFTELRHIYLDLTPNYFSILQQMGRGERLCKHARLSPSERNLQFHLPVPVLTTGWTATGAGGAGDMGSSLRVTMENYVAYLKTQTRKQTWSAPLHIPTHALDSLMDLQRSRVQFLAGMQQFASVAMDAAYYKRVANWTAPTINLTHEATTAKDIQQMIRQRVREAVEQTTLVSEGIRMLKAESTANERKNNEVLNQQPHSDASVATRSGAAEQAYRDEVMRLQRKEERKETASHNKAMKQQRQEERNLDAIDELRAAANCKNYTITEKGRIVRTDKPNGYRVDQEEAMNIVKNGARVFDPHCMALMHAIRLRDEMRKT